ncbi:MAG TPA: ankyrin repeat domain-containing protein [Candidatus Babeliales bacterium]|nr:ankyrin repeat domain-containing protein [Candidatus Babeliales bacterium]
MKKLAKIIYFFGLLLCVLRVHTSTDYVKLCHLPVQEVEKEVEKKKSQGYGIDHKDSKGFTLLAAAVRANKPDIVELLFGAGADPALNGSAMMEAKDTNMVRLLVANKISVNSTDKDGQTALLRAAAEGRLETVKALVEAGANLHNKDNKGQWAWQRARKNGHIDVAVWLEGRKEIGRIKVADGLLDIVFKFLGALIKG